MAALHVRHADGARMSCIAEICWNAANAHCAAQAELPKELAKLDAQLTQALASGVAQREV